MIKFKKILLIIFVLVLTNNLFAQDTIYQNLVSPNKQWNVLTVSTSDFPDTTFYTTIFKFEEDTIIDTYHYLKVYKTLSEDLVNWQLIGCIREDSTKKVWYKPLDSNERIKYDFDMQTGDTITIENYPQLVLDSIKEEIVNQEFRKCYYLSNDFSAEKWIEGIGSTLGVLNSGMAGTTGGYSLLLCMFENNEIVWHNPNYNECWMASRINEGIDLNVNIYVSATNNLIIRNNEPDKIYVEIYNISGIKIFSKQINGNTIEVVNFSCCQGIILCKINKNNNIEIKRIILV